MKHTRVVPITGGLLVVLLGAAGCGSDGGDTDAAAAGADTAATVSPIGSAAPASGGAGTTAGAASAGAADPAAGPAATTGAGAAAAPTGSTGTAAAGGAPVVAPVGGAQPAASADPAAGGVVVEAAVGDGETVGAAEAVDDTEAAPPASGAAVDDGADPGEAAAVADVAVVDDAAAEDTPGGELPETSEGMPAEPVIEGEMPLVYDEEFTGADCPQPALASFSELESVAHLPDPFVMASGERMTSRSDWRCRRAEIKATLEKYDVGAKPAAPTVEASLSGNSISITVSEGGKSFQMSATINRPGNAADGPIPAIIGINTPTGSLPGDVFSSRGIATITYNAGELASTSFSGPSRSSGNFWEMYPETDAGYMIRWAFGVSRLIDALEQLPEANIDTKHLAVSGCSFQGKIALYSGAFDERIALTIPHESGGGGTISWRYSDMLEKRDNTEVENLLHAQGAPWYAEALMQFNNEPNKLPFDHHELVAMVAPRAFLAVESTAIARMGAEAARVDALAAREVYTALGVPFRMGTTEENTNHCVWHNGFTPDLEAYVDKFLLEKDVDTDILRSKFDIDTDTWIPWETPELE